VQCTRKNNIGVTHREGMDAAHKGEHGCSAQGRTTRVQHTNIRSA